MKITRIDATSHRVPAKVPLLHEPIMREIVFVRVETDGGEIGYGLTGPIQRFAVREFIKREIAPLLIGTDPLTTERHWYDLFYRLNPRAQTGTWSSSVSAVDIALWDIKGKHLKQPVWRLLGGYSATVPAYITFGLLEYSREQLVEVAKQFPFMETMRGCWQTFVDKLAFPSLQGRTRAISGATVSCWCMRPSIFFSRTWSMWGVTRKRSRSLRWRSRTTYRLLTVAAGRITICT
jgi:hypothetical protein